MMAFQPLNSTGRMSFGNFNPEIEKLQKQEEEALHKSVVSEKKAQISAKQHAEDVELAARFEMNAICMCMNGERNIN